MDYAIIPCGCVRYDGNVFLTPTDLQENFGITEIEEDDTRFDPYASPLENLRDHLVTDHHWLDSVVDVYFGIKGKVF